MTVRWPIHPQPQMVSDYLLEHESVTSWLMRQAWANRMGYREFLRYTLGDGEWRRKDLDLLDKPWLLRLAEWGYVAGGATTLRRGTITKWSHLLPIHNDDRRSWISSLWVTRHCPKCLAEDPVQYLRAVWRLHVTPLCGKHDILLRNTCGKCGRSQPITQFYRLDDFGSCHLCGHFYSGIDSIRPEGCNALLRYTHALPGFLRSGDFPKEFGWPYSRREFFDVLRFLVRLLGLRFNQRERLAELRHTYGLPQDTQTDWRKSEAVACILLNESLKVMQHWPENFARFIDEKRALFIEVATECGDNLPHSLVPYRVPRQGNHRWDDLEHLNSTANRETRVCKAVDHLIAKDRGVGPVTVQRLTGIDYRTLRKHANLNRVITNGRRKLLERRIERVTAAIDALRPHGHTDPSIRAVAAYLGRSTKYIRSSPELLALVRGIER